MDDSILKDMISFTTYVRHRKEDIKLKCNSILIFTSRDQQRHGSKSNWYQIAPAFESMYISRMRLKWILKICVESESPSAKESSWFTSPLIITKFHFVAIQRNVHQEHGHCPRQKSNMTYSRWHGPTAQQTINSTPDARRSKRSK